MIDASKRNEYLLYLKKYATTQDLEWFVNTLISRDKQIKQNDPVTKSGEAKLKSMVGKYRKLKICSEFNTDMELDIDPEHIYMAQVVHPKKDRKCERCHTVLPQHGVAITGLYAHSKGKYRIWVCPECFMEQYHQAVDTDHEITVADTEGFDPCDYMEDDF